MDRDRLREIFSGDVVFGVEPDGVWMNGLGELKDIWGVSTHPGEPAARPNELKHRQYCTV